MSSQALSLKAEPRDGRGNGPSRRMRRSGRVPAVIYGHGQSASVSVDEKAILGLIHHPGLITIDVAGKAVSGIIKEVQRNPISGKLLHADIQEVRPDELITVTVQIESKGVPAGAIAGGQLEQVMRQIEIRIQAKDLFETLTVDISAMQLDQTMHVKELPLPEGVKILTARDQAVFQVRLPKAEEVAEPVEGAAAAAGTEPEVIAKGKKDEEGAEGEAAAKGGAAKAGADKGEKKEKK